MRVAGREDRDGVHNLEVMLESLSGGRRREIQEDGLVMEVKKTQDNSKTLWTNSDQSFWRDELSDCNKRLDFSDDPDQNANPGIFVGTFPLRDMDIVKLY